MYLLSSSAWFLKKVKGGLDPLFDKKSKYHEGFCFFGINLRKIVHVVSRMIISSQHFFNVWHKWTERVVKDLMFQVRLGGLSRVAISLWSKTDWLREFGFSHSFLRIVLFIF